MIETGSTVSTKSARPAAFLDRDGVINRDLGYVYRADQLEILPGVAKGLSYLSELNYRLIVVSNQSGVARGYFSCQDVENFHQALQERLTREFGLSIDAFYYCPHHPKGSVADFARTCTCRKPSPGLLEQARRDFDLDWSRSFMVGDKESDISCAHRAGLPGIQVQSEQYEQHRAAEVTVRSLGDLPDIWEVLEKSWTTS